MMQRTRQLLPAAMVAALCLALAVALAQRNQSDPDEARRLIERYNRVVCEAYRKGDVRLLDPVVGPAEGRKLTGLIGVRSDLDLTLDAELLALEITGVTRTGGRMEIRTKERWRYRDRKKSTGRQVGEESQDSYEMVYLCEKSGPAWVVDQIRFAAEPVVGRKTPAWVAENSGRKAP
jgi:hypothetical protein